MAANRPLEPQQDRHLHRQIAQVLVVLASAGGNDMASIDRAGPDQPVSLRTLAKRALHRGSIHYKRHNACEASCAKMAATGLARR